MGSAAVLVVLWLVVRRARALLGGPRAILVPLESRSSEPPPGEPSPDEAPPEEPDTAQPYAGESWSPDRPLCACCEYPLDVDAEAFGCAICEWSEPDPDDSDFERYRYNLVPEPVKIEVGSPKRDRQLEAARANFARYCSALLPDERPELFGREVTPRAIDLRRQLRERFDYLRRTDPPDKSEQWEAADDLMTELRDELQNPEA